MNLHNNLRNIFKIRQYPNIPTVSPPAYVVSITLIIAGILAYFFGGPTIENLLRYTSLATSICAIVILLLHLINPELARWSTSLLTTLLVITLTIIWEDPALFTLLVIPVFLSGMLVNLPAVVLTATLQTFILLSGAAGENIIKSNQTILVLTIWLAAIVTFSGYFMVERILERSSEDYSRLQDLLYQSRDQQQRLSYALEDLEHANRQLSLLYDRNIALRRTAEEATESKTTYIARVSHEIRTPLNMILGITESIIENQEAYEDDLPIDLVDDIKVIRRNSEHLLSLVNDVLDLTRAETSRLVLRKEWTDIGIEVQKSVEIVQPLAKKKMLDVGFSIISPLPQVYCDQTRIRQVILNLLSNAVRYTENGQVQILISADEFWLTVEVKDTGPGVDTNDVEKIFEPFYRGSAGAKYEIAGTGLGLSVCRQFIDLHGGKIWLESQPGKGSKFCFRLPVTVPVDTSPSPVRFINEQWIWVERKRERKFNFQNPGKKRVVVFGSSEPINANSGFSMDRVEIVPVDSMSDLENAVSKVPAHMIVINTDQIDDLLPTMLEAVGVIKDTPIIGSVFASISEQVRRSGALDYVQKPFNNNRLRQSVEQVTPYPRKILVVDDNIEVQRLIVRILSAQNETTQYFLAENGVEALEVARRKRPDLILLDLAIPEIDGWQVLRILKETADLRDIPVILVSAHDLNESPASSKAVILMNGDGISLDKFHNLLQSGI